MAMTLVSTVTVGSGGAASIQFTNIPQTGKDLLLVTSLRNSDTGTTDGILLNFNSSTSNFSARVLYGTGSSALSTTASFDIIGGITGNGATASTFSNGQLYISNYASGANKSYSVDTVAENNATATRHAILAGQWANSAAITSIAISGGYNFMQHSTASLYIIS
jgi:hypothetical protein